MSVFPDLPIAERQSDILRAVQENQVTIITAETGAGKSTQVPQYLAEAGYEKVIVTQPRILASRTLSERVREEHALRTGNADPEYVAYRSSYERDDTENTVILYCTDGLQLVREITGAGTASRQVLVLDEIHEWNENMEVLLAWAKKRCQEEPDFKLVLMSATIDSESLRAYFNAGPVISVAGRTHSVSIQTARDLVEAISREIGTQNILVFLPGKAEIEQVAETLAEVAFTRDVPIIPLHSQLSKEDQALAFDHYPNGKVVLSTNIAQTSVTIDDIDTVIDSGLERRSEVENGVEGLFIGQISQADCLQRAGRAGRTKPGTYILAPYNRMPCLPITQRPAYATPEILRKHLDRLVLRLASAGLDIEELEFYHAPKQEAIKAAKRKLRKLGALTGNQTVTPIGQRMERFPVESSYARMLVEAETYSENVWLTLSAIIGIQEVGGIVRGGSRNSGWRQFTEESDSDLLAQYEVYLEIKDVDPKAYEELGIIDKGVVRAEEVIRRLCLELSLDPDRLAPLVKEERPLMMRCIVAGLVDQLWSVEGGIATHLTGNDRRELSGSSVVRKASLVAGTPFDLEVPTQYGLEILHLVQAVTSVDPRWLEEIAPGQAVVEPGKIYFDSELGSLATKWRITLLDRTIHGVRTPVTERSDENSRLFVARYSVWLLERLDIERRQLQKRYGRKIPAIPLAEVQKRVQNSVRHVIVLDELTAWQREDLARASHVQNYIGEKKLAKVRGSRKRKQR